MSRGRSVLMVLVACGAVLGAAGGVARADTPIAEMLRATHVSALNGTLAWSEWYSVPPQQGYRLVIRQKGKITYPNVRIQPSPFDLTVGLETDGHTVITYSRCANGGATQCDAFRYDPGKKQEVKLKFSTNVYDERWPIQWKKRFTWVRSSTGDAEDQGSSVRCDRPYTRVVEDNRPKLLSRDTCAAITGMALRGSTIAETVTFLGGDNDPTGKYSEIRFLSPKGGEARHVGKVRYVDESENYSSPVLDDKYLYVSKTGVAPVPAFVRVKIDTGKITSVEAHDFLISGIARDGKSTIYVDATDANGASCSDSRPCRIVETSTSVFGSEEHTLPPRLTVSVPTGTIFANQPLTASGDLTQFVVKTGVIQRTLPVPGIALQVFATRNISGYEGETLTPGKATATTDANGHWELTVAPPLPIQGTYAMATTNMAIPVHSSAVTLSTIAALSLSVVPADPGKVTFTGRVDPAPPAGTLIRIRRRLDATTGDSAIAEVPTAADGTFTATVNIVANAYGPSGAVVGEPYAAQLRAPIDGSLAYTGISPDVVIAATG